MNAVWVRGEDDVLVRADAIVVLAIAEDGLRAECASGRSVRLTRTRCSGALPLVAPGVVPITSWRPDHAAAADQAADLYGGVARTWASRWRPRRQAVVA